MTAAAPPRRLVSLTHAGRAAAAAFVRFPGALIAALAAAGLLVAATHTQFSHDHLVRGALCAALGIAGFFAIELRAERAGWSPRASALGHALGALALVAYFWTVRRDVTDAYVWRSMQLALALHLLDAFAPFAGRGETNGFWQFNRRLFVRFFESALYGGVCFAGLALAVWGVGLLFEARIPGQIYADLAVVSVFVVQTWRFLAVVPHPLDALEYDDTYPGSLRVFTQYLLVPLAVLYGVILYAYAGRIVVSGSWPKGLVAWLVSGASVFGMMTLLFLHPARGRSDSRWVVTYGRWFYPAIVPLLAVLVVALAARVGQYGMTERRYFLAVLGAWLLGIAGYFILTRSARIMVIPVSLCVIALLTSFGPWGAYRVSEKSQQRRLVGLLERHGRLPGGKAQPASEPVPWQQQREISSVLTYLIEHHGPAAVTPWFVPVPALADVGAKRAHDATSRAAAALMAQAGLRYVAPWESSTHRHYMRDSGQRQAVDVTGYDRVVELTFGLVPFSVDGTMYVARLDERAGALEIQHGADVLVQVPLDALMARLAAEGTTMVPAERMTVTAENRAIKVKVVFQSLTVRQEPDGRLAPTFGIALVCLRLH